MRRMSAKTRKTIYLVIFGCATLIMVAALAVGLVGIIKKVDLLIHISPFIVSCGLFVNVIDEFAFKQSGKKSEKRGTE